MLVFHPMYPVCSVRDDPMMAPDDLEGETSQSRCSSSKLTQLRPERTGDELELGAAPR